MAESLIIQLGEQADDPIEWAVVGGEGVLATGVLDGGGALHALATYAGETTRVIALLPGEQVALRSLPAPPKRADRLKAAAELLLEDELAEGSETLHIVTTLADEAGRVYAVRKSIIRDWLAIFAAAGLRLDHLCPDFAALGADAAGPVCVLRRGRLVFSNGVSGFAIETSLAPAILDAVLKVGPGDVKPRMSVHGGGNLVELGGAASPPDSVDDFSSIAEIFAKHAGAGGAVNLLSGEFRRKSGPAFDIQRWRRAAIIGAGVAASIAALVIAGGVRDGRLADRFEQQASTLYQQAFPGAPLTEMRASARRMLATEGGSPSFVSMSAKLAAALERHEAVSVERIRFDSRRGQFAFTIRSQTDAEIEAFRSTLTAEGLAVRDGGGYRRTNAGWTGELVAGRV